ncbi:hypothetical protein BGZ96_004207 [Linnemannia gamsii]|uniref:Uncharacterized protein n=1 Tax=Linnemannia gamsii TaxID=64522 RepID=A0ABQ7KGK9_9FUNG|nr:hypothetical protein BGZ96_004207 [Linnemannia gamsii]
MLLIKTVLILCSASIALAAHAVVSGAIFDGVDTTDRSAEGCKIFQNPENHAAAAASILTYSASNANFRPADQPPKSLSSALDAFVKKASTFPGFKAKGETKGKLSLDGSFTQFEEAVRDELDCPLTARALRDLIPGYIEDKSLTDWTLSLVVLSKQKHTNEVNIKLARVSMTISREKSRTAYIPKQTASLVVMNFQVNSGVLISNADRFAEMMPLYRVHRFIDFFNSPKVVSDDEVIVHDSLSCFMQQQHQPQEQAILSW